MDIIVQRKAAVVKQAIRSNLEPVAGILARAFQNEPTFSFIFPHPVVRARRLPKLFRVLVKDDFLKGKIFVTEGGEAATLWRSPQRIRDRTWDHIRLGIPYLFALGMATGRASRIAHHIAENLPHEDCWYLHLAGCVPEARGKGFGSAVIRAGLAVIDSERSKAYLETADKRNLPVYEALGFEIIKQWTIADGPTFWGMIRLAKN